MKEISKTKILIIGDVILDRFLFGDAKRISPEAPVPVVKVEGEEFKAGGGANVAMNLVSVGAKATLCGIVGDDYWGNFAIKNFSKNGIDTSAILKLKEIPTTIKTRIIARHQQVVRIDKEEVKKINAKTLQPVIKEKLSNIDAVIIADYGKGVITKQLLNWLIPQVKKMKKIITVDPQVEHFLNYREVTSLTPNHFEISSALGMPAESDSEVEKIGTLAMKKLKTKSLIITRGEKGMSVFYRKKIIHIPTQAKEVFDVTGAGDTVIAIFTLCLAKGLDILTSAKIANKAAGIVVGKFGTATLTKQEFKKCMQLV